jgi:hypothetical protein
MLWSSRRMKKSADKSMSDNDRKGRWSLVVSGLIAVFALYVLSTGPVIKLMADGVIPPIPVNRIYAPLETIYRNVPVIRRCLDWYLELWIPERAKSMQEHSRTVVGLTTAPTLRALASSNNSVI